MRGHAENLPPGNRDGPATVRRSRGRWHVGAALTEGPGQGKRVKLAPEIPGPAKTTCWSIRLKVRPSSRWSGRALGRKPLARATASYWASWLASRVIGVLKTS